ncbi:MAG TPA: UDP-N-acetylmuramate dehydrogenase [Acidimicrobiales bacterium]|jgi:UDP-N-acetylmuramate dehydrogenase|nr:UDP-N-acetylmuramate dehydrogenase [Acidimicrobiales bacterium]
MSLDELVAVGGTRVSEHAPFGARTTYRVGGTVRALVTLSSSADLEELGPAMTTTGLPMFVLGNGSNLLVADGEHDVLGVHLVGEFEQLTTRDEGDLVVVDAGAGMALPVAARRLAKSGVVGFEWAVGVPGSFGGAAVMNAGGHGSDMNESLVSVTVWHDGATHTWTRGFLDYGYRSSALASDDLVTSVRLHLRPGDSDAAQERIREIVRWRREHQPGGANAGSAFRNPEDDYAGRLIEAAGCKGLRIGTAVISEKHANFIIADADGRGNDVYELLTTVRELVRQSSGVELVSEHRFLGFESS